MERLKSIRLILKSSILLCTIVLFIIFSSCVKNNSDPSWLKVNQWNLISNEELEGAEGELTQNISQAWVYIDDQIIGVFEVPFEIPVLKKGNVNIKIYPAILNNGISATKKIYPFLEFYEINAVLTQNQTLTVNPITKYKGDSKFWIEDFEDSFTKIITDPNTSSASLTMGNNPEILKWGNFYGEVVLNSVDSNWVGYTNQQMFLPRGEDVYLEIDYYNTNSLVTGVLSIGPNSIKNNQNIRLNQQKESIVKWKKIYIELKEIISNSIDAEYFEQSFEAFLDDGDNSGVIIIDNVKVVYF